MNVRKVVSKRIRHADKGVDVVGEVNAAIAANVGERGSTSRVSSRQHVVHRSGVTAVSNATDDGEPRARESGD
jgi:hypothetical protein